MNNKRFVSKYKNPILKYLTENYDKISIVSDMEIIDKNDNIYYN